MPDRRMDEVAFLRSEVGSWEDYRNRTEAKVRWRFTTEDARIKLEKLYPVSSSTPILMGIRSRRTYQKSSDSRRVRLNR